MSYHSDLNSLAKAHLWKLAASIISLIGAGISFGWFSNDYIHLSNLKSQLNELRSYKETNEQEFHLRLNEEKQPYIQRSQVLTAKVEQLENDLNKSNNEHIEKVSELSSDKSICESRIKFAEEKAKSCEVDLKRSSLAQKIFSEISGIKEETSGLETLLHNHYTELGLLTHRSEEYKSQCENNPRIVNGINETCVRFEQIQNNIDTKKDQIAQVKQTIEFQRDRIIDLQKIFQ